MAARGARATKRAGAADRCADGSRGRRSRRAEAGCGIAARPRGAALVTASHCNRISLVCWRRCARAGAGQEIVELGVDIIVATGTPALVAAREAAETIPIVFVAVADPVAQGFVRSLAQPGGIITGFGVEEPSMGAKWMEVLKEIAPRVASITVMFNPDAAPFARMFLPSMEGVRSDDPFELFEAPVASESDVEGAITAAAARPAAGLIVLPDSFLNSRRELIVAATAKQRLPTIYALSEFIRSGGLIAYGIERTDLFRRSASYVDRILKGDKPGD